MFYLMKVLYFCPCSPTIYTAMSHTTTKSQKDDTTLTVTIKEACTLLLLVFSQHVY